MKRPDFLRRSGCFSFKSNDRVISLIRLLYSFYLTYILPYDQKEARRKS